MVDIAEHWRPIVTLILINKLFLEILDFTSFKTTGRSWRKWRWIFYLLLKLETLQDHTRPHWTTLNHAYWSISVSLLYQINKLLIFVLIILVQLIWIFNGYQGELLLLLGTPTQLETPWPYFITWFKYASKICRYRFQNQAEVDHMHYALIKPSGGFNVMSLCTLTFTLWQTHCEQGNCDSQMIHEVEERKNIDW